MPVKSRQSIRKLKLGRRDAITMRWSHAAPPPRRLISSVARGRHLRHAPDHVAQAGGG